LRPIQCFAFLLAAAATLACGMLPAAADDYPTRPVKIIVPFGAGGPTDVFTRAIAEELKKSMHEAFVMENRPGAGSVIGTAEVARAAPDGYTLVMLSSTQTVNETLMTKKPYQLTRDFVPVAPLVRSELVLVVHPSVAAKSTQELLALARANPGKLNFGSSGPGSNYHMAAELLKTLTGIDIVHVPYKGSTGARQDIVGGQVQMMFDSVPTMAPLIAGGNVRAIATTGKTRSALLPAVPTLAESGVPGYEFSFWTGFAAPAATPEPVVAKLNTEINRILSRPDIKTAWEKLGAEPMIMTRAEYAAHINNEIAKWAKVIKTNNIQSN
jgi:tripartite-type tricarboxylate transporter receptor subunit TctC